MKKNFSKACLECIPDKYKNKTCMGCDRLTDAGCGKLKSIRYSSGAKYTVKVPDENCSIHNVGNKAVNI